MIELGTGTASTNLPPELFFERWADPATWPDWDPDVSWARLDDAPGLGARGKLKPTSGPALNFVVTGYEQGREFTDTGSLPGSKLTFHHTAAAIGEITRLQVLITIDGPTSRIFAKLIGAPFRAAAQASLDRLVVLLEKEHS